MLGSIAITGRRRAGGREPTNERLRLRRSMLLPLPGKGDQLGEEIRAWPSRAAARGGAEDDRHDVRLPTGRLSSVVARLQPDGRNWVLRRALDGSIGSPPPQRLWTPPPRRSPLSTSLSPPKINNLYSTSSHVRRIKDCEREAQIHKGTRSDHRGCHHTFLHTFHFHRRRYPNIQL